MPWEMLGQLVLAAFLGGLIGMERALKGKPAGMRTHLMVCLGSALIMLISIHMGKFSGEGTVDPARIASNVVVGLGFLGAGTIMRLRGSVLGLTTAASLWAVGGIGLAVGCGYYFAAIGGIAIMLVALWLLDRLEIWILARKGVGKQGRKPSRGG